MTYAPPRSRPALTRHWGAEPAPGGLWRFGLWAPLARQVAVEVSGRRTPLVLRGDGFHRATAPAQPGEAYRFLVDGQPIADPAARAQRDEAHGPSVLVDPAAFGWRVAYAGRRWDEAVLYQMHIGTFTAEGTFAAATRRLPDLAALGITALMLMPVAQFPGTRGWGQDQALPFAPHPAYGTPDDLRHLIDTAHGLNMMVLQDVVWWGMAPEAALRRAAPVAFAPDGRPDFTLPPVRSFLVENALMWLEDYRMDGLRLDAPDRIEDSSSPHVLTELAARIHAAGFARPIHLIAGENPVRPERFAAVWSPGYQTAIEGVLTGEGGSTRPLADLCIALSAPRPWAARIHYQQTHAVIGNRAFGERLTRLADPRAVQVALALLLTAPFTPHLFMGEEVGERAPFHLFADLGGARAEKLRQDRAARLTPRPDLADLMPDPMDRATFAASRPFRRQAQDAMGWRQLTAGLLKFRAQHIVPLLRSGPAEPPMARPTGPMSLLAEWPFADGTLRLAANFGSAPLDLPDAFDKAPRLAMGHIARDDHAFALWLDRPRRR